MTSACLIPLEKRKRGGFLDERFEVLPVSILERCRMLPVTSQLHVTNIGVFRSAMYHYCERSEGTAQTILIYCVGGNGVVQIDQTPFQVAQGHVAFIPANTPHIYSADISHPWSIFWLHFDGQLVKSILESLCIDARNPLLYLPDVPMMCQAFEDVFACLNYHYSDAGLLSMTSELLALLAKIKLHSSSTHKELRAIDNRIKESIDFMERHVDIPLSLEYLAAQTGQSVTSYGKKFKRLTGQSPMEYFIQLKISKARELLGFTDLTVKAIAEELGYDDPYYFSRLFKKIQGDSPAHYRASIKG